MSKYSGHGGYLVFAYGAGPTYVVIHNITHEPNYAGKAPEHTDSASGGWAEGLGKVATAEVSVEANDDDAGAIDLLGVPMLQKGTLYARRGELEKFDVVANTLFMGVGRTVDNQEGGAPRVRIRFQFGSVTTWVAKAALPAGLRSYLQGIGLLTP